MPNFIKPSPFFGGGVSPALISVLLVGVGDSFWTNIMNVRNDVCFLSGQTRSMLLVFFRLGVVAHVFYGEFDPGSGRTLAACLTHASRTMKPSLLGGRVANG